MFDFLSIEEASSIKSFSETGSGFYVLVDDGHFGVQYRQALMLFGVEYAWRYSELMPFGNKKYITGNINSHIEYTVDL